MADQSDLERTEEPTPHKREEAFSEGRVARSQELGTAALFLAAAITINRVAPIAGTRMLELFSTGLRRMGQDIDSPGATSMLLTQTGRSMVAIILVLTAGLAATGIAVGAVQARGVFTTHPLSPQWNRIDPIANARQIFGTRSVAELLKSLLKMTIVGWAVWRVLSVAWPDVVDLSNRDAASLLLTSRHLIVKLFVTAGLAYLFVAVTDYVFQLWQHTRSLRMTKDEVRREMKQQDGDPLLKSRMRSIARSRARRQMFADVPKADVVIVNPTHIAVALRYDPLAAPAPVVLAMGQRLIAERIKRLAHEHGIPVIENKPLARALLAAARVGMMIPAELYIAVAEVLAFVIRQRARHGAAQNATLAAAHAAVKAAPWRNAT